MDNFDYILKTYGNGSLWNLMPSDNDDPNIYVISSEPQRLELEVPTARGTFQMISTGEFIYSGPLDGSGTIDGTIDSWRAYLEGSLYLEEIYPAGTSARAWQTGDYAFTLSLLDGNDYFEASKLRHDESDDGIRGGDGNDTFIGYGSVEYDDYFFGEGGIDTAVYQGRLSEYTIQPSDDIWDGRLSDGTRASGYVVTDQLNARDDTDQLVGVERLQFSDVTLALDIDGVAAEAYRIYKAAFDRQPDSEGLGFWIKQMDAGMAIETVAEQFIGSAEFIQMYGSNPSDEQFVDLLYANVLDRQPDQAGYDFWIGAMSRGLTRAGVLAEFSESAENIANVAPLIEGGIQYTAFVG